MTKTERMILDELKAIKADVKGVRETDIPNLKTEIAVMKVRTNNASKLYAGLSTALSALMAFWLTRHGN